MVGKKSGRMLLTEINLPIMAVVLSSILLLQSLTVATSQMVNAESIPNQYGSMQSATYPEVHLQLAPSKPTAGQDVTFSITFRNQGSSMPKSHVDYKFTISKDGSTVFTTAKHTHSGTDTVMQKLATDGTYKITVTITDIDFKKVEPRSSDFTITVEKPPMQEQTPPKEVPAPPPVKEEQPAEPKLDVRVQAKQIKDLIIVRVRSMDDSTADVYGFQISIAGSPPKAAKGPKGWEKEGLTDAVTFTAANEPLRHGDKQFFMLKVDATKPVIEWKALGPDGDVMAEGSLTPLLR